MMNTSVKLRCEIQNNTGQDIWLYDDIRYDPDRAPATNARICVDMEGRTLLVLRRINHPRHGISTAPVGAIYTRLRARESQPCEFFVILPVRVALHDVQGFEKAILKGTGCFTRLAFQIGYYTNEDLQSASFQANIGPSKRISVESEDRIRIHEDPPTSITYSERFAAVEIEGACIPYKRWIIRVEEDPEKRAQQLSEKPTPLTPLEKLRDLFYNFSLDLEQYRYACQLLVIDRDLLGDQAIRLVDVYIRVAQGKLDSAELARHLDEVMGWSDREKLLRELQEKQDARNMH